MALHAINFETVPARLAAAAATLFIVAISILAFIWGFASAASSNAEFKEVSDLLAVLSPSDPQTHFAAASFRERALEPGDFEVAMRHYEIAASLAPNNYLLWLRLAAARGRAGDTAGAEAALLEAKRLAPNYSRVQWAWGNFLLREGREDEAYTELRKAVSGDPALAPMAATTALQISDGDARIVSSRFAESTPINVALTVQLAGQKRFEEALEIWNRTDVSDERYREVAKQIRDRLIENKKFLAAVSMNGAALSDPPPAPEKIKNPGFEHPVTVDGADSFDWRVSRGTYPQVGVTDAQKSSGKFSLLVLLVGPDPKEFRGPSQLVAVRPGTSYGLTVAYRSDAKSASSFHWEVVSAVDGQRLALSTPLVNSTQWSETAVSFTAPRDVEGVEIRFVRGECTSAKCAESGSFWFDDFSLIVK